MAKKKQTEPSNGPKEDCADEQDLRNMKKLELPDA